MTPVSHTLYTVTLFFALLALLFWKRRRKRPVASMTKEPEV
jgi:hypothetical protein